MSTGDNIRSRRKAEGLTLEELAEAVNTTKQTIHRYERGIITNIPQERIEAIARALHTSPSELMGWNEDAFPGVIMPVRSKRIPMLGSIACGKPIYAEQEYGSYVTVDEIEADFCLRAKGDSMTGARIHDGDIVFIRSQESVDNGEIAAVIIEGEATLKRVYYYPEKKKLILSPENPCYEPLLYTDAELEQIKIIGKAVAFQSLLH